MSKQQPLLDINTRSRASEGLEKKLPTTGWIWRICLNATAFQIFLYDIQIISLWHRLVRMRIFCQIPLALPLKVLWNYMADLSFSVLSVVVTEELKMLKWNQRKYLHLAYAPTATRPYCRVVPRVSRHRLNEKKLSEQRDNRKPSSELTEVCTSSFFCLFGCQCVTRNMAKMPRAIFFPTTQENTNQKKIPPLLLTSTHWLLIECLESVDLLEWTERLTAG